jgi:hypothetical protein
MSSFSVAGYLVGQALGERQGITDKAVLDRLSLLSAVMGTSPMGIVMTTVLAQREAEENPPTLPTTPAIQIEVPDVKGMAFNEAKSRLELLELTMARQDLYSVSTRKGHIINQHPEPGAVVSKGATIALSVSLGSELPTHDQPPKETASVGGASNAKKGSHQSG